MNEKKNVCEKKKGGGEGGQVQESWTTAHFQFVRSRYNILYRDTAGLG